TGFARAQARTDDFDCTWEVKSVNGRGLDVRCRLPPGMESLEPGARAAVSERFARGHLVLHLQLTRRGGEATVRLNREVLEHFCELARELESSAGAAPPRADGLLALRGVIEVVEPEETEAARAAREKAMMASLAVALDRLEVARREEGERLGETLFEQLDEIEHLTAAAATSAAAQPEAIATRLAEGVAMLLDGAPSLNRERLEQEAALLINKADVREEIDRLRSHAAAAREQLGAAGPAGRRLDFLAQELNREANTLCAKSADIELTQLGLELKVVIDRFREQIQNIE
ncbi:MAG: YicC family protein, partial [Alphaproteobacteria bacterium]|nr:YicC family protein [Alphaproteobacteria bacterium]